ncbi:TetR/AcrR family transcriptional regulator [Roseateles sp. NT4]|uniref:TetR/AcrR family transcriptional regulator n=1 Tax=Roseateles sp. NT4 TaxID=3453715 RepID=UPI003EEEA132
MKVTKEQSELNRQALLDAAARLFKQHGIDGVGVADICKAAGLTHGALYKHFADKQDLAAQAFAHSFRKGFDWTTRAGSGKSPTLATYLDQYLSRQVRDDHTRGCPVVTAACDTGRQSEAVSQSYTAGFLELREGLQAVLAARGDDPAKATLAVAALIGAMAISRGVMKTDEALANEVLKQVRQQIEQLAD